MRQVQVLNIAKLTTIGFLSLAARELDAFQISPVCQKIENGVVNHVGGKMEDRRMSVRRSSPLSASVSSDSSNDIEMGSVVPAKAFESAVISEEDINPIFRFGSGKNEKVVTLFGLWAVFVTLITCPIWYLALKAADAVNTMNDEIDPNRSFFDMLGKIWSKTWLFLNASYPQITGNLDQISEENGACLYVANHASWIDIPVVCTVLHPVFKFISKGSLKSLPCIGDQLHGGKHILIDREDRRSQLRTFKEGIGWLDKGVSLMAFPEGQRSLDGRLMEFKGGAFSMAVRQKIPVVPITISNAHALMPSNAIFPLQSGSGKLAVHIHPAIHHDDDRTEDELASLVRAAIISKLPMDQLPIVTVTEEEEEEETAASNEVLQPSL